MNKRGITWDVIIYGIIAVIVLIAIVLIFREQLNALYKSFIGIIKQTSISSNEATEGLKDLTGNS